MTDLTTAWADVNLRLGSLLNTPLIQDRTSSYVAVTSLRVLIIGTTLLACMRLLSALRTLPKREKGQSLRAHFKNPWWRTPALMMQGGLLVTIVMRLLQIFAGNMGHDDPLGNLTPYLLISNVGALILALGVAMFAGCLKAELRGKACPTAAL